MCDRAPRVLVAPGAATGCLSRAARRPQGIVLRRSGVVAAVFPVEAPLMTDARESEQPQRVRGRFGDARRSIERRARWLHVAPGEASSAEFAPRRLLPLGL